MGKYGVGSDPAGDLDRSATAVQRALTLDPDLPMATLYSAQLDLELGRSREALVKLLGQAQRHPSDPHLLAGLVQACRYCGLVDASIAAHEHVRRLDRSMPTAVVHTYWLKGDFERALELGRGSTEGFDGLMLSMMGREDEAIASLERDETRFQGRREADFCRLIRFTLQQNVEEARAVVVSLTTAKTFVDPEGFFYIARACARIGDLDESLRHLGRVADGGFCGLPALTRDPWLDGLRGRPEFRSILTAPRHRCAPPRRPSRRPVASASWACPPGNHAQFLSGGYRQRGPASAAGRDIPRDHLPATVARQPQQHQEQVDEVEVERQRADDGVGAGWPDGSASAMALSRCAS